MSCAETLCWLLLAGTQSQGFVPWLILSDARVEVDVKHWGFAETLETVSSLTLVDISKERLISHLLHC